MGSDLQLLVSIATGVLFGIIPACGATRIDLQRVLRDSGRSATAGGAAQRFRAALIIGEVALSLMLLIGAGLMIRTFMQLRGIDLGFRTDRVLTTRVGLPPAKYGEKRDVAMFYDRVL